MISPLLLMSKTSVAFSKAHSMVVNVPFNSEKPQDVWEHPAPV